MGSRRAICSGLHAFTQRRSLNANEIVVLFKTEFFNSIERLAVVRQPCFGCQVLNDCFHRKRPFKFLEIEQIEWLQTAEAGSKETSDGQFDVLAKVNRIF